MEASIESYNRYKEIADKIDEKLIQINAETQFYSGNAEILKHPSFLELVNMGQKIIPYIIFNMTHNGASWVHLALLSSLTTNSPITESEQGYFYAQLAAWLNWYISNPLYNNVDIYQDLLK